MEYDFQSATSARCYHHDIPWRTFYGTGTTQRCERCPGTIRDAFLIWKAYNCGFRTVAGTPQAEDIWAVGSRAPWRGGGTCAWCGMVNQDEEEAGQRVATSELNVMGQQFDLIAGIQKSVSSYSIPSMHVAHDNTRMFRYSQIFQYDPEIRIPKCFGMVRYFDTMPKCGSRRPYIRHWVSNLI